MLIIVNIFLINLLVFLIKLIPKICYKLYNFRGLIFIFCFLYYVDYDFIFQIFGIGLESMYSFYLPYPKYIDMYYFFNQFLGELNTNNKLNVYLEDNILRSKGLTYVYFEL